LLRTRGRDDGAGGAGVRRARRRRPESADQDAAALTESRRDIRFWTAVSLVIGGMVGSGVFTLPAALAAFGGLSVAAWAIAARGSVLLALRFHNRLQRQTT